MNTLNAPSNNDDNRDLDAVRMYLDMVFTLDYEDRQVEIQDDSEILDAPWLFENW